MTAVRPGFPPLQFAGVAPTHVHWSVGEAIQPSQFPVSPLLQPPSLSLHGERNIAKIRLRIDSKSGDHFVMYRNIGYAHAVPLELTRCCRSVTHCNKKR